MFTDFDHILPLFIFVKADAKGRGSRQARRLCSCNFWNLIVGIKSIWERGGTRPYRARL
jgi:hypothetical protein